MQVNEAYGISSEIIAEANATSTESHRKTENGVSNDFVSGLIRSLSLCFSLYFHLILLSSYIWVGEGTINVNLAVMSKQ